MWGTHPPARGWTAGAAPSPCSPPPLCCSRPPRRTSPACWPLPVRGQGSSVWGRGCWDRAPHPTSPSQSSPCSPGCTCLAGAALAGDEDALVPVPVPQRAVGIVSDGIAGGKRGWKGLEPSGGFRKCPDPPVVAVALSQVDSLGPTRVKPLVGSRAPRAPPASPCSHVGLHREEAAVVILLHLLRGVDGQGLVWVHRDHHVPNVRLRDSGTAGMRGWEDTAQLLVLPIPTPDPCLSSSQTPDHAALPLPIEDPIYCSPSQTLQPSCFPDPSPHPRPHILLLIVHPTALPLRIPGPIPCSHSAPQSSPAPNPDFISSHHPRP